MSGKRISLYSGVALAFLTTFVLGAFLIFLKEHNQVLQHRQAVMEVAAAHGHLLQQQINRSLSATYALAAVLRQGQGDIDHFDALANEMLRLYDGTSSLQLAPKGIIARIVPLAGNEAALGHNLLQDPERNKEAFAAVRTRQLTLAGPFALRQGGTAVVGRLPVFLPDAQGGEQFWGFTTALVRIADLLAASKLDGSDATSNFDYELSRRHPDSGRRDIFAASSTLPLQEPVSYRIEVPNGEWTLSLAPREGWHSAWASLGAEAGIVLLTSLLATLLAFNLLRQPERLRREVALRTRDLRDANLRLESEIIERQQAELALRESESQLEIRIADRTAELMAANGALREQQAQQLILLHRLEALQHNHQLILDSLGEGVFGVDNEGRITFVNPALTKTLGWTSAELIDGSYRKIVHPTGTEDVTYSAEECPLSQAFWTGQAHSADNQTFWRKDGSAIPVEYTANPIREEGHIVGAVVVFKDITQRQKAEQALRQSYDELKRMHQELEETHGQLLQSEKMASIGQLAAGVAHEINNPIGFISSNLGSLQRYVDDLLPFVAAYEQAESLLPPDSPVTRAVLAAKQQADLDYLKEDMAALLKESLDGVSRVKHIVQDLKDFSHVDNQEWHAADLNRGLDSTLNVVWNELKYKADVVKEYGKLPLVDCMAAQLNQVFMNLLVNAAQAIEQHGTITLRTGTDALSVWVEIADTGKGIAPEHLPRIFEPFFTTKPVGKGTGLGLSISYGIVKRHGGTIEAKSVVGQGTTFRITLPQQQVEDAADPCEPIAA